MAQINHSSGVLAALLAVLLALPAAAAERKLFTLASAAAGVELQVLDVAGAQSAKSSKPAPKWTLVPGDRPPLADGRPRDRIVELYTGTLQAPSLVCRVLLRYYPSPSGWTPHFRLEEEPLLARINGRWQPFELMRGMSGALILYDTALPNAEGFFPGLEFGLSTGPLAISAWQVR